MPLSLPGKPIIPVRRAAPALPYQPLEPVMSMILTLTIIENLIKLRFLGTTLTILKPRVSTLSGSGEIFEESISIMEAIKKN